MLGDVEVELGADFANREELEASAEKLSQDTGPVLDYKHGELNIVVFVLNMKS